MCDFVKDDLEDIYFVGVKYFLGAKRRPAVPRNIDKPAMEEILEEKASLVYCRLCKVAYRKEDVQRVVTMKMIAELKWHFNKRGIFKFDHLSVSVRTSKLTPVDFSELKGEAANLQSV